MGEHGEISQRKKRNNKKFNRSITKRWGTRICVPLTGNYMKYRRAHVSAHLSNVSMAVNVQ